MRNGKSLAKFAKTMIIGAWAKYLKNKACHISKIIGNLLLIYIIFILVSLKPTNENYVPKSKRTIRHKLMDQVEETITKWINKIPDIVNEWLQNGSSRSKSTKGVNKSRGHSQCRK